ncbi:MAG: tRNA (adenosine(37)-N6)-dimethylallyltransferase MiaA [Patescibacteria group bacterium]
MKQKPKIIVVLGPTATGKSDLAVDLALTFNGEVVSADSRQVYKGLDLGTGKITKKEMRGVPHHLLNVANPKKRYTVSFFQIEAKKAIKDILSRGKLPIICGGTGFYIQSIVDDIILPDVPVNQKLRKKLSKKTAVQLYVKLQTLDSKRAKNIDPHNRVRLIRAIEIASVLGKTPPLKKRSPYDVLQIGLDMEDHVLTEKIYTRILSRIKKGMISEAKKLHSKGLSYKRMRDLGLEYRFLADLLEEKIDRREFVERLALASFQYVKKQRAWFKRDKRVQWFNPTKNKIKGLVKIYLSDNKLNANTGN